MQNARQLLLNKRNAKTISHLVQYAPVWLVEEAYFPIDDAIQFEVVFQHPSYGWVNRRYRYDGFNDVLYHKGQTRLTEDEVVGIQEREPYVSPAVSNSLESYGG